MLQHISPQDTQNTENNMGKGEGIFQRYMYAIFHDKQDYVVCTYAMEKPRAMPASTLGPPFDPTPTPKEYGVQGW